MSNELVSYSMRYVLGYELRSVHVFPCFPEGAVTNNERQPDLFVMILQGFPALPVC